MYFSARRVKASPGYRARAFALRYRGCKRTHDAGEMMAAIVAKRLVEHIERSGFVVMKKPPIGGGAAIGRGHDGR